MDGATVKSEELLLRGPIIVVFYRGFWYPPPPPSPSLRPPTPELPARTAAALPPGAACSWRAPEDVV